MDEESKGKRKRRLINNRQELLVLISSAILFYAGTCCFSIMAPFYAPEVKRIFLGIEKCRSNYCKWRNPLIFQNLSFTHVLQNGHSCLAEFAVGSMNKTYRPNSFEVIRTTIFQTTSGWRLKKPPINPGKKLLLTLFTPMSHFYTSWKRQKTFDFRGHRNRTLA